MKKLSLLLTALILSFAAFDSQAQFNSLKKFDYTTLKNKVLYIPAFDPNSKYAKKLVKKGKFEKLKSMENYTEMWKRVMAQSSYDATPYEVKQYNHKQLIKEKNNKAILLRYVEDKYRNWSAQLIVTGPKRRVISAALINGLDLGDENDLRLMINMLNYVMNELTEIDKEGGSKSYWGQRKKYKESLVEFYQGMSDKTFLVPKSTHKNAKKAANRNADLKAALKSWNISEYKFTNEAEIQKSRMEGNPETYYWKSFAYYTQSPLITYRVNYIFTSERDEPIFYFLGTKRLKPQTLKEIQTKIKKRAERFMAK